MNNKKNILVFNSGSGSGFQELVENAESGILNANIIGLITNKTTFPCVDRAQKLGIDIAFMSDFTAEEYQTILKKFKPDFVVLSGWLKPTRGLNPCTTINIHPAPLPDFGGLGMYGHHAHEAVIKAYKEGRTTESAVTMHFVTEEYDEGPVFFRYPIVIRPDDTAESLGTRVNKIEHGWQSFVTNLVVAGSIHWNGKNHQTLVVPEYMERFL